MNEKELPLAGRFVRVELVRETGCSMLPEVYVRTAADAAKLMDDLKHKDREHFVSILLDAKNGVMGVEIVSIGTLEATLVSPREVLKSVLLANAAGVICLHNHPSGDPTPSAEDIRITKTLKNAFEIMGLKIFDHIIIGQCAYASLLELGLL